MNDFDADKLLALEIEKAQKANGLPEDEDRAYESAIFEKLRAPFPREAYSTDSSRGFNLTSVKAQFVVERLNEVLGIMNWSHGGDHTIQEDGGVIFKGTLIININGRTNRFFATGYSAKKKNLGDMYKSAKTDSLGKAASQIGVANDAFKGMVDPKTFELKGSASVAPKPATTKSTSKASSASASSSTKTHVPKMFERKSTKAATTAKPRKGL